MIDEMDQTVQYHCKPLRAVQSLQSNVSNIDEDSTQAVADSLALNTAL